MILLLILAQAADLVTGLMLPPGVESNPLGAVLLSVPPAAIAAKAAAVSLVVIVARVQTPAWRHGLLGVTAAIGVLGAASNVRYLL